MRRSFINEFCFRLLRKALVSASGVFVITLCIRFTVCSRCSDDALACCRSLCHRECVRVCVCECHCGNKIDFVIIKGGPATSHSCWRWWHALDCVNWHNSIGCEMDVTSHTLFPTARTLTLIPLAQTQSKSSSPAYTTTSSQAHLRAQLPLE